MIGAVAAVLLLLAVLVLVPLRFARALRRSLKDPEFRGLFALVVVTLLAGTLFYWQIEGWSLLDSFYFSSITLTTVGYGDFAPETAAGKLFTVFYLFTGIGLIVAFLNAVAHATVEQRSERKGRPDRRPTPPEEERKEE
ncbi:two pore domain potassium channel family protein [Rubrobacter tropicus]|uniref:Two pore domain potassium channel family protein n=2 Tax=Rubrobacter tropicus TaxID=2653851 RepID=A0A6G8QFI2_9ACTN|nr:two pore domain potassium channel family protein [Rubrobacter tropicus]